MTSFHINGRAVTVLVPDECEYRLTRVRRLRYYPVRIVGDRIEVDVPAGSIDRPRAD